MEIKDIPYDQFVATLIKQGEDILRSLTPEKARLWHTATLASGEAGEMLDAVKKHVVYNKPLDLKNLKEEAGDLEFALQDLYNLMGWTREEVIAGNKEKLAKRYPTGSYSDSQAQNRADKA